ncbi:ribokinase [Pseudoduganella sp. FT93W]|uniref:Ribokinase n=2 Tax=Duganella fentianensis TaxID=2692177 RepID=A0A845I538_9BURK|nr:ribokinase [Duganella fentianensis]MYN47195.1 ribokinase [Duganella fentianensis]
MPGLPAVAAGRPVVVVGSLNMDLVFRVPRMPVAGETLQGHGYVTAPGGKGANQAVACARMGCAVALIGQTGQDGYGDALCASLRANGVDIARVGRTAAAATGVAVILVEDQGRNRIVLAAGANGLLGAADIDAAGALIATAALLIVQLEVPLDAVLQAMRLAAAAGVPVLLNPAPAQDLPEQFWPLIDILVPNESEAALLTGLDVTDVPSACLAAARLHARGARRVLVTLSDKGVVLLDEHGARHLPARAVSAVDTTAAGDTFIGALATALCEGQTLDQAAAFGQSASALCVTRAGAQPSIPYRHELTP